MKYKDNNSEPINRKLGLGLIGVATVIGVYFAAYLVIELMTSKPECLEWYC